MNVRARAVCVHQSMRSHASAWWSFVAGVVGNGEGSRLLMRPLCSVAGVVVVVALWSVAFCGCASLLALGGARPCELCYVLCSLVWSEIGIGGRWGWVELSFCRWSCLSLVLSAGRIVVANQPGNLVALWVVMNCHLVV